METLALLALLAAPTSASETPPTAPALGWKDQPIAPKHIPDFTAYTIPQRAWKLGFTGVDYGLLDNLQAGAQVTPFLLGVVNLRGKVTAVQTEKIDASLDGAVYGLSLAGDGVEDARARISMVGWKASWLAHEQLSLHLGTAWYMGEVTGQFPVDALVDGLIGALGVDLGDEFGALVDQADTDLYGGAQLSMRQLRLAADVRLNRRDSLIFASNTWLNLQGRLDAGVEIDESTGLTAGAATAFEIPFASETGPSLSDAVPTITTLSWQFSWERLHLRAGIGLGSESDDPATTLLTLSQAFKLYWIL